jgi:hypothetical protein
MSVTIVIAVHPQAGLTPAKCNMLSEFVGGLSYDAFGTACWRIYGKAVQINPNYNSIKEGFDVMNFNFNATGKVKPVENQYQLPGPKQELV